MTPRPTSRIESLEKRATAIEAGIIELSSDTAEELKVIRQEMKDGFLEIGKAFDLNAGNIETVKRDVAQIKTDLAELKGLILQLLQQRGE